MNMPLQVPIHIGARVISWEKLKKAVEDWLTASHFSYYIPRKDQTQADYRCTEQSANNRCPG
jgi:hypothetical protein